MVFFLEKGDIHCISFKKKQQWSHLIKVLSVLLTGFSAVALFFTVQLGNFIWFDINYCALGKLFREFDFDKRFKRSNIFRKGIWNASTLKTEIRPLDGPQWHHFDRNYNFTFLTFLLYRCCHPFWISWGIHFKFFETLEAKSLFRG